MAESPKNRSISPSPNPGDPVPFHRMSDDVFEEMCSALLAKEPGIRRADLYGRPREPQFGIDVLGEHERDGVIDVVSCKCHAQIKRGDLAKWSDDFLTFWDSHWQSQGARRFVLAVAADIKSSARRTEIEIEKARFSALGLVYEIWPPRTLQEKIRSHPGLVAQFLGREWVPRLCGPSASPLDARGLLDERATLWQSGSFAKAAACAEAAAELVRVTGDKNALRDALRCAARDLGDHFVSTQLSETEGRKITARIASHIAELEVLELPKAEIALERALLARLEAKPDDALAYAQAAERETDDPEALADALLVQLQANWQKGSPERGLDLRGRIEAVESRLSRGDPKLVLRASWLRTLLRAGECSSDEVAGFVELVRGLVAGSQVPPTRAVILIDEVVRDFGRANDLVGTLALLKLALEVTTNTPDAARAATISLQIAEISAELVQAAEAQKHLGIAEGWMDRLKSDDATDWMSRKALALVTSGNVEARLARKLETSDAAESRRHRRAAYEKLKEALAFSQAHEADLTGDFGGFRADLCFRLGEVADALGRRLEAARYFRSARSAQIMSDDRFRGLGARAWMREADALLFGGKPAEARGLLVEFVEAAGLPDTSREEARSNIRWLDNHIAPVVAWFDSDAATQLSRKVMRDGLRPVIADQLLPLTEWFQAFPRGEDGRHAYSEFLDIWGRGGFSRVVAAVRADALNAISVDATSADEIARMARTFCPLYETVIVNWKGPLHPALGIVPMPDNLGPPGAFGGQGYMRTSDMLVGMDGYHVAVGWANYLPREIAEFLATDALALLRSGRLVVFPAPLVGCTQTSVGWTDNLLADALLGGVVKTASLGPKERPEGKTMPIDRVFDLSTTRIPFIDNVPLCDLDSVLDDSAAWLSPLRGLLRSSIGSGDLRSERWDGLGSYFSEIREACRHLEEKWIALTASRAGAGWHLDAASTAFSAALRDDERPGSDDITDVLRSIARAEPESGPWIPFWRLQRAGGDLNWTGALDNRSTPPDEMAQLHGIQGRLAQGWLFPGDGGPGIATAFMPGS